MCLEMRVALSMELRALPFRTHLGVETVEDAHGIAIQAVICYYKCIK